MCGIIGYVGDRQAAPILLEGLAELKYRGYDSSGIAVLDGDELVVEKRAGKLGILVDAVEGRLPVGTTGIGHTRWATHGSVTDANAHPHCDCGRDVVVIHNGIVENYSALKSELLQAGHRFESDTDTEVIPHLVESFLSDGSDLLDAVRRTINRLEGAAALVIMACSEPDRIIGARVSNAGGVVVGYGDGEMLVASDLLALLNQTRRIVHLAHGELVCLTRDGARYIDAEGRELHKQPALVPYDKAQAQKGDYRHYMQKEIFEQPSSLLYTIRQYVDLETGSMHLPEFRLTEAQLDRIQRVVVVSMGTSLHAGMLARAYFERIAGLPAEVDNASEFRYRRPVIGPETLVLSISQSGETVDTLAAMEEAQRHRAPQITICNQEGAQSTRVADGAMMTRCGPEIAVASTKTLLASIAASYILACWLGYRKGTLSGHARAAYLADLAHLPNAVAGLLAVAESDASPYPALARAYGDAHNFLFLGRGLQYPIAMEGALKLKEISYLHAEGYPAGEMKHGPIALIDHDMPVVALAPRDSMYEKMCSNIEQVQARAGRVIAVATEGDTAIERLANHIIRVPAGPELLLPAVTAVPMQLLAYEIAIRRGYDVDQPRNLAKTVTVE